MSSAWILEIAWFATLIEPPVDTHRAIPFAICSVLGTARCAHRRSIHVAVRVDGARFTPSLSFEGHEEARLAWCTGARITSTHCACRTVGALEGRRVTVCASVANLAN